jgi:hypothetical protein
MPNPTVTIEITKECVNCTYRFGLPKKDPSGCYMVLCNHDGSERFANECCDHWKWMHDVGTSYTIQE